MAVPQRQGGVAGEQVAALGDSRHGTAGNAHALLHLFARTGDERWLARARALAMHGIRQVERERRVHGQGRHTMRTGDLGMACVRWDCLGGRPGFSALGCF